jgi:hypothetical protein
MAKSRVYLFHYRPPGEYDEFTYVFSTLQKAQMSFLKVEWAADLAEYLTEESLSQPTTPAETLKHYETVLNDGTSGAYFTIDEAEVDPGDWAELEGKFDE